jgi:COMPASS component SWD2
MVVAIGVARVLNNHTASVNSLDFSKDGELLLSSGDDHRICLYSTQAGSVMKVSMCQAHGAQLARFTHDPLSVIVASPMDHAVRYLSLHDKRYLRTFRAHTEGVVALDMSPKEDMFASASMDDTVRLWDLRSTNCAAVMRYSGGGHRPAVSFDPDGLVFAAAVGGGSVKMFDVRACDKGPFVTFSPDLGGAKSFSSIKFSKDGKLMLLATTQGVHVLLDAFGGQLINTFTGHSSEKGLPLEACFSPDSEYLLAGSDDGGIWRWETRSGKALPTLREHVAPVGAIKCNPTRMMLASADSTICMWLPDP